METIKRINTLRGMEKHGINYTGECPICHKNSLSINVERKIAKCFEGCDNLEVEGKVFDTYPIAYVRLRINKEYRVNDWIIDDCPYCHKKHTHGGGSIKDNPRDYLGHRVSHCIKNTDGVRDHQGHQIYYYGITAGTKKKPSKRVEENDVGYILIEKVNP